MIIFSLCVERLDGKDILQWERQEEAVPMERQLVAYPLLERIMSERVVVGLIICMEHMVYMLEIRSSMQGPSMKKGEFGSFVKTFVHSVD